MADQVCTNLVDLDIRSRLAIDSPLSTGEQTCAPTTADILRHEALPDSATAVATVYLAEDENMANRAAPPPGSSRKISFNVSEQYDIQDVVGEGAYGVVW